MSNIMNHKTEWVELAISVMSPYADAVANFLIEQGSNGIVEEEIKTCKSCVLLKAYLKNEGQVDAVLKTIESYLKNLPEIYGNGCSTPDISINHIADEDWNKKWKSFFKPIKITDRIVIKPSWRKYRKQKDEIIVELDPGMAFGTGTHPSTRLCLMAIEALSCRISKNENQTLLDVGTGSGILAITAALLGINRITAIDIDYQSIECAKKNAIKNGVAKYVSLTTSPLKKIDGVFDMVVSNILPHVLIDMQKELSARLATGGFLILSGILKEKAEEITGRFSCNLKFYREMNCEEWTCLVFQNNEGTKDQRIEGLKQFSTTTLNT